MMQHSTKSGYSALFSSLSPPHYPPSLLTPRSSLAFCTLQDVNHIEFDMDRISGDVLEHDKYTIYLFGSPKPVTVRGTKGNGVKLDGRYRQYIDVGENVLCDGNLANCRNGFTLRYRFRLDQLQDNTYFLSSAPVDVFYKDDKLQVEVRTPERVWRASAPGSLLRRLGDWHLVEISWHQADGLKMYVDGSKRGGQLFPSDYDGYVSTRRLFIGRSNSQSTRDKYASATFDELEFWNAKREYLIAMGILPEGKIVEMTPIRLV